MSLHFFRTALPLVLLFTVLSCTSEDAVQNTAGHATPPPNYGFSSDELVLEDAINDYRISVGLNALKSIEYVSYKCEEHNEYMIDNNVLNHDLFSERSQDIIEAIGAIRVSENIAYNYVSASGVLQAWLDSPKHKANIEGDFTHFGISVRENTETGKKYYTNIFIKK